MSPDPINTNTSVTTPPPPEPPVSKDASSVASTPDRSNDALMAALKLTLTRLGIDASTGLTISDGIGGENADELSLPRRVSASSASLIAALYQALELQQSIAMANGLNTSGNGPGDALSAVTDTHPAVHGYRDLGGQIADLAKMSGTLAGTGDTDTDEWDFGLDDASSASRADTGSDDPMTAAIGQLNQALQDHVTNLVQGVDKKVSLSAVLDGISGETKGVQWRPLGVLIDVQA